jgi:hypothetical protein
MLSQFLLGKRAVIDDLVINRVLIGAATLSRVFGAVFAIPCLRKLTDRQGSK